MADYLRFDECPSTSLKTKIWEVLPLRGGSVLGRVQWHAPWRRYAFHPGPSTLYDADCLGQIMRFLKDETDKHRAR